MFRTATASRNWIRLWCNYVIRYVKKIPNSGDQSKSLSLSHSLGLPLSLSRSFDAMSISSFRSSECTKYKWKFNYLVAPKLINRNSTNHRRHTNKCCAVSSSHLISATIDSHSHVSPLHTSYHTSIDCTLQPQITSLGSFASTRFHMMHFAYKTIRIRQNTNSWTKFLVTLAAQCSC